MDIQDGIKGAVLTGFAAGMLHVVAGQCTSCTHTKRQFWRVSLHINITMESSPSWVFRDVGRELYVRVSTRFLSHRYACGSITGPDHIAALAPLAVRNRAHAMRTGAAP
eukprot:1940121-Pyramimonas_sp.AAC.1